MPTPIVLPSSAPVPIPVPMSLPLQSLESLKAVLANPLSQALPNAANGAGISVAAAAPEVATAATMPTPIVLPSSAPVPMSLPLQSLESLKAVLANPLSQALPNAANGADISGWNVMLGANMVTAAPVQVDTRAPLAARPVATQVSQPMNVQITINAAPGQDERTIARMVAQEMQRIQNQQQARQRSSLRDRA